MKYRVKRPFDNRTHTAVKQTNETSYGKVIELYTIIEPHHLGIYTRDELEDVQLSK